MSSIASASMLSSSRSSSTANDKSKTNESNGKNDPNSVIEKVVDVIHRVTSRIRTLSSVRSEEGGSKKQQQQPQAPPPRKHGVFVPETKYQFKMLNPLNIKSNQAAVYSALAFFIHCKEHNRILLTKGKGRWFPFVQDVPNRCWASSAKESLPLVLTNYDNSVQNYPLNKIQFLEILRFQPPERLAFFTRVIFYISISSNDLSGGCCRNTPQCHWYDIKDILDKKIENLWGPEVYDWCTYITQVYSEAATANTEPVLKQRVAEFTYDNIIRLFKPYKPQIGQVSVVPPGSRCTSQDAHRIFCDFLNHCYPAFSMTLESFRDYFLRYKLISSECRNRTKNRIHRYFNAFNYTRSHRLSFEELLLGLCEIDYDKKHNNTRIAFVFRFYDGENKGYLNLTNFEEILTDLNRFLTKEKKAIPKEEIPKQAAIVMNKFTCTPFEKESGVTQLAFVEGIGKHVFRGTSNLCRSYNDIFQAINRGVTHKYLQKNNNRGNILKPIIKNSSRAKCSNCRNKRYKLQTTLVCVRLEPLTAQAISVVFTNEFMAEHLTRWAKFEISNMLFTKEQIPLQTVENLAFWIMKQMRQFNKIKFNIPGFMCTETERELLVQILNIFVRTLEPILKSEKRCKPCAAPSYVIGDIHGNIEDLLSLERTIWPRFPAQMNNYIFLGDYVDRGRWSVECSLYLIAMKILSPYHVTLLRGNHEVRDIQVRYTYRRECLEKYSATWGKEVFELTNKIFDMLPLCAVLDDSMFCCHGGLPECIDTIEEINREANEIPYPEMDSIVAWQIMWADPIKDDLFKEMAAQTALSSGVNVKEGFIFNRKRGTAHLFNEVAFRNFCMTNGLTHMTRAHEVPKFGFELMFDNRLATIFSCSHYCKSDNDCGVLLIVSERIRVIRIDTSANVSATD